MKKLLLGVSTLALGAGFAAPAYADFALTILHINDAHSRIQSITGSDSICSDEAEAAGECFGGIARLKTAIDQRRDALAGEEKNVLTLDAGDQFQGSLFYTTYKGEEVSEFMNLIGFDAMAVGNHEFDDGPEVLSGFIDRAEFPVLLGNADVSAEPSLADKLAGVAIFEIGGEQVAVVSVLAEDTDETASPGENVIFLDAIEYLQGAVEALEANGINKIIALTHVGFTRDQEIAAAVPGIDVIVGGHSHTLLSNTAENAQGAYPTMVANPDGVEVPIVQAYAYTKYLGEIEIIWDDEGNVTSAVGEPILLDASFTPDETIVARIEELSGPLEEIMAEVIGTAAADIDGSRETCRAVECELGNLAADALLDRVADQGIQIAFQNGGGIRASIAQGEITMGDALTVFPFSNTLATFQLSGAGVLEALENGVSDIENGAGRFPQVAGLRYSFDASQPAGSRVSAVEVDMDGTWTPLDPEATYGLVTNNYMRNGGDGYEIFATDAIDPYDFGPPLEQVLAEYIAAQGGTYTPYTDGRITVLTPAAEPDSAAEPEAPAEAAPAAEAPAAEAPAADAPAEEPGAEAEEAPAEAPANELAPANMMTPAPEAAPAP
ncbi:multifunctional 2',3'-cyclic-nucleotide 2'-phosphodiesterase/5'-nucleotidase/3'-nucleotidase [Arsenicitalea aurantiaca]|uniref:Multifunctional 2',3'-cyclic-nucleotide 2'-phosphodiesterase/5'-nucleotidase/3'-nucleotidase n=1 Tax=Arsenicitalea aurantiaca TaxID=1783274 RepID=A0A433XLF0_9HYPH|nr:bifunctional metallophosphatase/5'-nucleotidase [Arsenicitalea aurantiaca]RUT34909.1 multifunctional 2',3'-cyclic-nucleotide 2'-phosphodiesterase/5'-nucleotidase/3'-nucleotidase [Arsenicitalea aurantiaca]